MNKLSSSSSSSSSSSLAPWRNFTKRCIQAWTSIRDNLFEMSSNGNRSVYKFWKAHDSRHNRIRIYMKGQRKVICLHSQSNSHVRLAGWLASFSSVADKVTNNLTWLIMVLSSCNIFIINCLLSRTCKISLKFYLYAFRLILNKVYILIKLLIFDFAYIRATRPCEQMGVIFRGNM